MYRSVTTINADVARRAHGATGRGVVVAVLATGIDGEHAHFRQHGNLELTPPLEHRDFTTDDGSGEPLQDHNGFGTSIASIVAGEAKAGAVGLARVQDREAGSSWQHVEVREISGMAPEATLVSFKVLDDVGRGPVSAVIKALRYIDLLNERGSRLRIDVVLLGVGYDYDPNWFACGQSPICVEADRLVRTGVVVVAASGNTGFGRIQAVEGSSYAALPMTITDPGNAESVITVASTHRDRPMDFGISYFSSRGPTHDGRAKPDVAAPGERIMVAASQTRVASALARDEGGAEGALTQDIAYAEDSGTSIAAAHVAGVVAQVLSVRPQLRGDAAKVKQLLMQQAQDLRRVPEFQGAGLVDALAALSPASGGPSTREVGREERNKTAERVRREHTTPLRLMFCYSHKDEILLQELKNHLSPLRHEGRIDVWWDRRLVPGTDWDNEIADHLCDSDIIVLLISSDFVASDYAYGIEFVEAIRRHDAGTARVLPVIARPGDFSKLPFSRLQALPKDGLAVTSWGNADEAWTDVARGIRRAVGDLTVI